MTVIDEIAAYDPATGYSADDNATCCEDCENFCWPEDDYQECGLGNHPGPFGGWADGQCSDWTPVAEIERLDREREEG